MNTLWAPWRMAFIGNEEESRREQEALKNVQVGEGADCGCFLCQAVFDETRDKQRHVLCRTDLTLTVLNKFPYNNGHLLVAPRKHSGKLSDLSEAGKVEIVQELDRWTAVLEKVMKPHGFNIGLNIGVAAGAGLPCHLHWHIVPRWTGDANFMTCVGSAKVIPQSLNALWELLIAATTAVEKLG